MAANSNSRYFNMPEEQRQKIKDRSIQRYYSDKQTEIKERNRINNRIYHQVHKDKIKIRKQNERFLRQYGITSQDYNEMLLAQGNMCAICGHKSVRFHVDHCHATRVIRGILCENCNRGLGMFKDNCLFLQNAQVYLGLGGYHSS